MNIFMLKGICNL